MHIEVTEMPMSNKGMSVVRLVHKKQELSWDVSIYDRVTFADIPTVFDCINAYWKTLPADRLDGIFAIYQKIHETMQTGRDIYSLNQSLTNLVAQLYALMPYEEIRHWVNYKADVKIPASILVDYTPSQMSRGLPSALKKQPQPDPDGPVQLPSISAADLNYPKELTYLRRDYQELAVLSVALRPMVPIWGEYIKLTGEQVGGMFKEYEAMRLLYETDIPNVEPTQRLLTYMEYWAANEQTSHSAIMGGLSMTILPSWLLAGCLVRRVVFGQIHAMDDNQSIISNIYRYVSSTMKSIHDSFNGKVNPKKLPMEMNEEDNSSLADMYKVKQDVSDADLVAMNIYTEHVTDMARRIDETLPPEMVAVCLNFMEKLQHERIRQHQIVLVQWIIRPALSPRSIPYLNKASMLRILAVTQAALWHWGFFDLAAFLTATERPASNLSAQWGSESRSRVPKEMVDELEKLYPHYRRQRGKDKSVRQLNVAYRAIDGFCEYLMQSEWRLNAPAPIAEKVQAIGTAKQLIIPPDIRATLARLMIRLASR